MAPKNLTQCRGARHFAQREEEDEQSRNKDRHPDELGEMDGDPIRTGGKVGKRGCFRGGHSRRQEQRNDRDEHSTDEHQYR
jgi:hypothetical protein